jgi:hypothetical protein
MHIPQILIVYELVLLDNVYKEKPTRIHTQSSKDPPRAHRSHTHAGSTETVVGAIMVVS